MTVRITETVEKKSLKMKNGFYNFLRYPKVLQQLYKQYGPIVYERIGPNEPIIHVFDVKDVETVYKNEDKVPKIFPLSNFLLDYRAEERICPGLGQTNDEEWYRLKNGIRDLMLKIQSVKRFTRPIGTVSDDLVAAISSTRNKVGEVRHLHYLLAQWSMEGKIVMNKRLGYLNGSNADLAKKIIDTNAAIFELGAALKFSLPLYRFFKTPKLSKLVENEHFIHRFLIISIAARETNGMNDVHFGERMKCHGKEISDKSA